MEEGLLFHARASESFRPSEVSRRRGGTRVTRGASPSRDAGPAGESV